MNNYQKIVFIEDGSIPDTDKKKLEELGCIIITYKQGANMPELRMIEVNK